MKPTPKERLSEYVPPSFQPLSSNSSDLDGTGQVILMGGLTGTVSARVEPDDATGSTARSPDPDAD